MIIDLAHLDRATAGDEALRQELLLLFRSQLIDAVAMVEAEAAAPDDLAAMLHRVRGGAAAVGATRLAGDLAAAEAAWARHPPKSGRSEAVGSLGTSLRLTLGAIEDLIAALDRRGLAKGGENG